MATQAWSTRIRHDSDAVFREWGSELEAKMAAAGLVQTSDTGQINWTTVTRSGINTLTAGYSIWRFNDTQQSAAPIYFRIDYGTGSSTSFHRFAITVGTGSNGSGTITGGALTAQQIVCSATSGGNTDTVRQSYLCVTEGFFGFQWKIGSGGPGSFFIARTNDSAGTPNSVGALVSWGTQSTGGTTGVRQMLLFASGGSAMTITSALVTSALGIMPGAPSSSAVGSDTQVAMAWVPTPQIMPLIALCGRYPADTADSGTFSVTMFGSTSHTYLMCTANMGQFGPIARSSTGGMAVAMLYE